MLTHLTSEPTVMATVAAVCFASDLTACTYALAGHPPPLVVDPVTGDVTALDAAGALIGAHLGLGYDNAHAQLAPGAVLALFTDGVVERRGEDLDAGTVRMARALELATTGRSLEQAADAVMRAAQQGGINDDMALLLARRPVHDGRDVATEASSDSVVPAAQSSCRRR